MNKFLIILVLIGLLAIPGTASAVDLRLGVETDFVIEREIELEKLGLDADYSAQYYDLTLTTQIAEWLTITPKVGLNYSAIDLDTPIGAVELNNELGWNLGVNAKADVYTVPQIDVDLALIGSYRFSRTEIDEIDIGGLVINNPIETTLSIHEWEAGLIASKDLKDLGIPVTPYAGVVYSDMIGEIDVNLSAVDLNEDIAAAKNVGIRFGLNAELPKDFTISACVSLIDETAIILKGSRKF